MRSPLRTLLLTALIGTLSATLAPLSHAAAPPWDANLVNLRAHTLAPGVVAMLPADAEVNGPKGVPLATTSGIVVGTRASLVIDTMVNQRLAQQVLRQAQAMGAGKPTYALNTSYHGDHSFGNMYFPKSTLVIQHEVAQAYIAQHLEKDKQFMVGAFGAGRGIEAIRARPADLLIPKGGRLQLDLGDKRVEIHDFGFAQTGGDLWVWLPQEKVLFAGNPVISEQPSLPWLLDGQVLATLATLERVRDFLPADARIVPGHGRVMGKAGLDWHIAYLAALRDQTRAALAKGLSLEATVAAVDPPEFQGYALHGWIHKMVNVPAAYRELQSPASASAR